MCGIAGILNFNKETIAPETLLQMGNAIAHRGPDDSGIWANEKIGFAHQRLSIIDTSEGGKQPMHSNDGNYTIVYNGELYNHQEFRKELEAKGVKLHSQSDTEIVLNLYIEYGATMLHRLNGMFAFAIWDERKQELFICRDRVGVKPFYYYKDKNTFRFGSEPKAIFASGIEKELNQQNISEWLLYRYVAGSETLLKNIVKLLPGHYAIVSAIGSFTATRWWNLSERIANHPEIKNKYEWFENTFHSSVKYRMIADVPVGLLLSGGLDSSSLAASLKLNGFHNLHTFNVGFKNYAQNESHLAQQFAKELNYKFHSIYLEKTELFKAVIQSTIHYDEPLVHLNDPQLLSITKVAKPHVKALLSGEGADEIMGGYVRYKTFKFLRYRQTLAALLAITPTRFKNTRIQKLERYIATSDLKELIHSNAANYFAQDFIAIGLQPLTIHNSYRKDILEEANTTYQNDIVRQLMYYDQHTYLQSLNDRNDRATMAASVECRDPFMDYRLIEGLGAIDKSYLLKGKKGKHILLKTMERHLPSYITQHKKVGFSVPWKQLINDSQELSDEYQNFLSSDIFETIGIPNESKKILLTHDKNNTGNYHQLLLQFFFMFIWQKYYLSNSTLLD